MIYFYHGADIRKGLEKSNKLISLLLKKKPDASLFKMNSENFDVSRLGEYIKGQGLFSNKYIVFLDRLCENKEVKEEFMNKLKEISESNNIFIVLEGKIDKVTATKIEKKSKESVVFDEKEKINKNDNNVFALANAFGKKNIKEAWMLYRKAIDAGEAPEALHGMIFWKVKSMILVGENHNWKNEELMKLLDDLITIYHEARRGKHELETGVEGFILQCAQ